MSDRKSKHKEERKRKRSRSREQSVEKEEKRSRNGRRDEEKRSSRHERREREEKEGDRRVKEEKEVDRRGRGERDGEKRMKEEKEVDRKQKEEDCDLGQGQERLSMSVEETNKMRAKLGLKPLRDDRKDGGEKSEDGVKKEKKEDVHKPAINMAELKRTAELKEKLAQMKEKRKSEMMFSKVKPLACDDDEEDGDVESVLNWVAKSRKIEEKKKNEEEVEKAGKEFGVEKMVKQELGMEGGGSARYTQKDLRGMKIEHDSGRFKEGKEVVLTLKDKDVLDEKEDILVNVNMLDDEAAEENTENRKKKLDYNPYEDLEYDEFGRPRDQSVLSKYDDEIRGSKVKKTFTIGVGAPTSNDPSSLHGNKHMQSLILPKPTLVSEYYTQEEIELSGRPRKVKAKKLRKKAKLTADDLLKMHGEAVKSEGKEGVKEEGGKKEGVKKEVKNEEEEGVDEEEDWDAYADLSGMVLEEDGVDLELEMAIKKASRVKLALLKKEEVVVKEEVEEEVEEEDGQGGVVDGSEMDFKSSGMVLNSTAEYCRSLGDLLVPSLKQTTGLMMMHEDDEEEEEEGVKEKGEEGALKGWQSVDIEEGEVPVKEEESHVLDEEPILNKGVGAALMLASKKGYLNSATSKVATARLTSNLESKNYSIEDKRVDEDDKYRNKRDRYTSSGPTQPFREKEGYDPDVKLEYIDDLGREMSKKEAFRYLSHQFHGKGSGLKKIEKRMKKEKEDVLNRTLTADTPLTTVQMLQEKQRHSKLPYVILATSKAKN